MSEQAIRELLSYASTVREDDIVTELQDAITTLEGIYSDLEDKRDCVVSELEDIAGSVDTYESLYESISEDLSTEYSDKLETILSTIEEDIIDDYQLFADLCVEGYKPMDFKELVERIFRNADRGM